METKTMNNMTNSFDATGIDGCGIVASIQGEPTRFAPVALRG